jgi:arylsulfatase A
MKFLTLIVVLLCAVTARAEENLNIIVIYADDMGYGDCTINNPNPKITSNIDRLTKELRVKASVKAGRCPDA